MVRLSLLTTIPSRRLESCAEVLSRPAWESALQWAAVSLLFVLLVCVLAISFIEADRILRGALVTLTRGHPVQPPLDLRLLSHSTPSQENAKEKLAHEERHKNGRYPISTFYIDYYYLKIITISNYRIHDDFSKE